VVRVCGACVSSLEGFARTRRSEVEEVLRVVTRGLRWWCASGDSEASAAEEERIDAALDGVAGNSATGLPGMPSHSGALSSSAVL
jgi:hypothetical protein